MINYFTQEIENIKKELNTLSYNTRLIGCTDGVITSLIEQAKESDIPYDCLIDALNIYKHKRLEKMPKLTEILHEALSIKGRSVKGHLGCDKCMNTGMIDVKQKHNLAVASCNCDLGVFNKVNFKLISIQEALDNGWELTELSKSILGLDEKEEDNGGN